MRQTLQTLSMSYAAPSALLRAMRLTAVALGVGLVMAGGVARAQDADEDDRPFEDKLIGGLMRGIGATNMENSGIDYRERSPLVVPRNLDLPPPEASAQQVNAPNWPKDPDVQARKEARAAARKSKPTPMESARPLMPSELAAVRSDSSSNKQNGDQSQPGNQINNPMLSPSQLGFNGSLSSLFGGSNKAETAPFTGEPTRESLTQPPTGYQTPSPNFAYGTGPKEALGNKRIDVMSGKEVSN